MVGQRACLATEVGRYGYQIRHWNPLVSVLVLVSRISEEELSLCAIYNSQHTDFHTLHTHTLCLHTYVKPNTIHYTNIHSCRTLSLPPAVIKTNHIRVTFHFHTTSTKNIKTSGRITSGGRYFIFYCLLFHLNYDACVGLDDLFNIRSCATTVCVLHTWAELKLFLAHKDVNERKEGVLFLALVMLITCLWEVNSSIQLVLFMDRRMYSLEQGIIYLPVRERPSGQSQPLNILFVCTEACVIRASSS